MLRLLSACLRNYSHWFFLTILLLLIPLKFQAQTENVDRYKARITTSNQLLINYQFQEAIDIYSEILEQHQEDGRVYMLRGVARLMMGDYGKGNEDFEQALKFSSDNERKMLTILVKLSKDTLQGNDPDIEDVKDFIMEVTKITNFPVETSHRLLIEVIIEINGLEKALEYANTVIEERPDEPIGHFLHGYVMNQLGKYDQALSSYNKSSVLSKESITLQSHINYGNYQAYNNKGEYFPAFINLSNVLRTADRYLENDAYHYYEILKLLEQRKVYEYIDRVHSIDLFILKYTSMGLIFNTTQPGTDTNEVHAKLYSARAKIKIKQGKLGDAMSDYDNAIRKLTASSYSSNNELINTYQERAKLLNQVGRTEDAVEDLEKADVLKMSSTRTSSG